MNIKEVASRVLGVGLDFEIQEISCEGLYVEYSNNAAIVGGGSIPALARAYMLLAKGYRKDKNLLKLSKMRILKIVVSCWMFHAVAL